MATRMPIRIQHNPTEPSRTMHPATHIPCPQRPAANDQGVALHQPLLRNTNGTRGYRIAPVRDASQQAMADALVRRRFAWRGYNTDALAHRADQTNRLTLAAWLYDELIATLTLVPDSADGFQTDTLYAKEMARLRRPGRRLCEVSRLAVDPDFSYG